MSNAPDNTPADNQPDWRQKLPRIELAAINVLGPLVGLIVVMIFFVVLTPGTSFVETRTLGAILSQATVVAMAAIGATLVILSRGIDLSVGSVMALSVVTIAWVLQSETLQALGPWLPFAALLAGVLASTLAGAVNGTLITGLGIVPFIVTLGMLQFVRGITKGLAGERNIYTQTTWLDDIMSSVPAGLLPEGVWRFEPWLWALAAAAAVLGIIAARTKTGTCRKALKTAALAIGGLLILRLLVAVPWGVGLMLLCMIATAAMVRYTRLGRHIVAIGSNEATARLCGIRVGRTKLLVYVLAGFFAGLAGLLQYSRLSIGDPTTLVGAELSVIAAVVIGGGSLFGGQGSILGAVIGAVLMQTIAVGGNTLAWASWIHEAVTGAIIIAAVALDRLRQRMNR